MRFSERWLRTLVNPALGTAELCDALTMAGLEVESVERAAPAFSGVVVARIEAVAPHPSADRLYVATVDVGHEGRRTIVCGAPNVAAGQIVPCALDGARLPGGVAIGVTRVRGVDSQGMLCSAAELGLGDDASGLLVLGHADAGTRVDARAGAGPAAVPGDAPLVPGTELRDALALDDALITIKLTPNRPDCLSLTGIAREVAAITGARAHLPAVTAVPVDGTATRGVRIEDEDACPRFASRVIEDIDPLAPTPAWMKSRLERSGIRSISAVVDITNYVMLELGQPLHAYDDRRLDGDIVVRFARDGDTLLLLNGQTLALDRDLLLVCDAANPLGLAGIMGGERSGIGAETTRVFLEGAFWNPAVIQGKMRRLGFVSDAGYRFERGVDFELGPAGVERATELILAICGGRAGPLSDVVATLPARTPIRLRSARVAKLLGIPLSPEAIADIFDRLALPATRHGDDFLVTPPSYRFDLAIEEDLVEEVARIHGYDAIPARLGAHESAMLPAPEGQRSVSAIRHRFAARGWQEIVTFGFVAAVTERLLDPDARPIDVLNPIAAQFDVMRTTLLPGLIGTLQTNLRRRIAFARIFEAGRVFLRDGLAQPARIGGLAFGTAMPEQWGAKGRRVDLYDIEGDLAAVVAPLVVATHASPRPWLHPGRSAGLRIGGVIVGWLGELHPRLLQPLDLPSAPVVFELDMAALQAVPVPVGRAVSRMPSVRRDIAIICSENIAVREILDTLRETAPVAVEAVEVFDVYRGAEIGAGRKSVAILVLMRDTQRTLTDADSERVVAGLVATLKERFGATLR
ncbi:MAG: phenylalanine--tRNA ligase subunit beta [Proteobacteria bacterium]|nr:phenylalanine--tRNA ligase subunit beta [Pseudomonadota bacterium]